MCVDALKQMQQILRNLQKDQQEAYHEAMMLREHAERLEEKSKENLPLIYHYAKRLVDLAVKNCGVGDEDNACAIDWVKDPKWLKCPWVEQWINAKSALRGGIELVVRSYNFIDPAKEEIFIFDAKKLHTMRSVSAAICDDAETEYPDIRDFDDCILFRYNCETGEYFIRPSENDWQDKLIGYADDYWFRRNYGDVGHIAFFNPGRNTEAPDHYLPKQLKQPGGFDFGDYNQSVVLSAWRICHSDFGQRDLSDRKEDTRYYVDEDLLIIVNDVIVGPSTIYPKAVNIYDMTYDKPKLVFADFLGHNICCEWDKECENAFWELFGSCTKHVLRDFYDDYLKSLG